MLLEYLSHGETDWIWGWTLVALLFVNQTTRVLIFSLTFNVGIRTSLRIHGSTQYLGFSKLLRLEAPNDSALGQLVTYFTGDMERIHEAVAAGILITGTPVIFTLSSIYCVYLVGPWSLLGLLVILFFYPTMVSSEQLGSWIWFFKLAEILYIP